MWETGPFGLSFDFAIWILQLAPHPIVMVAADQYQRLTTEYWLARRGCCHLVQ